MAQAHEVDHLEASARAQAEVVQAVAVQDVVATLQGKMMERVGAQVADQGQAGAKVAVAVGAEVEGHSLHLTPLGTWSSTI